MINEFTKTEWRPIPNTNNVIQATYGWSYIKGNPSPHFSVQGEIRENDGRGKVGACGCCHDEVAQAFPELLDAIRWHLADVGGLPLHYIANAKYHWGQWARCLGVDPEFQTWPIQTYGRPYDPEAIFMGHCLIGPIEGDGRGPWSPEHTTWAEVYVRLIARIDLLHAAIRHDMAAIGTPVPEWQEGNDK